MQHLIRCPLPLPVKCEMIIPRTFSVRTRGIQLLHEICSSDLGPLNNVLRQILNQMVGDGRVHRGV